MYFDDIHPLSSSLSPFPFLLVPPSSLPLHYLLLLLLFLLPLLLLLLLFLQV
jgi:hypothetical protein